MRKDFLHAFYFISFFIFRMEQILSRWLATASSLKSFVLTVQVCALLSASDILEWLFNSV
jgi:hypothetical protein